MLKPEFTNRVDLGHLLQAGLMLVATMVGGGGIIGLYESVESQFQTQASQINGEAVQFAGLQQQVIQQGALIRQIEDDQRRLTENIDSNLSKLGDELADVRVLVAKNAHVR